MAYILQIKKILILEVLGSQTGIAEGSERKQKFRRGGGVNDYRIQRAWGVEHFGISEGKGGKILMRPVVGYGYFLESPNLWLQHARKENERNAILCTWH